MRLLQSISLRNRILILFLLISLGGIVSVSLFYYKMNEKAVIERTFDQLKTTRVVKERQLTTFFNDRVREAKLISGQKDVLTIATHLNNVSKIDNQGSISFTIRDSVLTRFLTSSGYLKNLFVCTQNNHFIAIKIDQPSPLSSIQSTKNLSNNPEFNNLFKAMANHKSVVISDLNFEFTDDSLPCLFIATPIANGQALPTSFLVLQISVKGINDIMLEKSSNSGLGNSGESYLVGNDLLMRSTSRFKTNSVLSTRVGTRASRAALAGQSGKSLITDYRGVPVFSSYSPLHIGPLKWAILAEIDKKEAMIPVTRTMNDIFYIGFFLSILITGLSFFISTQIIAPIQKLKEAAEQVEKGNYDISIKLRSSEDVKKLVTAFNSMTKHIKQQTEQLKDREERLTHFYNATADGILLYHKNEVILANKAFEELTGYSSSEIINEKLSVFIPTNKNNHQPNYESVVKRKNDTTFPVEIQENIIEYKSKPVKAIVIRDISQRKAFEMEKELERERRIKAVFDGQEKERQRISRELHDSLGQNMIALKLNMENIRFSSVAGVETQFKEINHTLDGLIEEIRQISNNIASPVLIQLGLEKGIGQLCKNLNKTSEVTIEFDSIGENYNCHKIIIIYLYRIAQEGITNAIKHSCAKSIKVQLLENRETITLMIEDDGIGFSTEPGFTGKGNGLYNIKERARILNGNFELISKKKHGTLVHIRVPKKTTLST